MYSVIITIEETEIQRLELLAWSTVLFDIRDYAMERVNTIKRFHSPFCPLSTVSSVTRNAFCIITDSRCDITIVLRSFQCSRCTL